MLQDQELFYNNIPSLQRLLLSPLSYLSLYCLNLFRPTYKEESIISIAVIKNLANWYTACYLVQELVNQSQVRIIIIKYVQSLPGLEDDGE